MKKVLCVVTSFIITALLLLPAGVCATATTSYAQSSGAYAVILPEIISDEYFSDYVSGTNASISAYVPFAATETENAKAVTFTNKLSVNFSSVSEESYTNQSDVSLFLYLFFPNYSTSSTLKIKLFGTDDDSDGKPDNSVSWSVLGENLFFAEEQESLVPGWRKLELPLRSSTPQKNGTETDPIYLNELSILSVEYSITEDAIGIFDAKLAESSDAGKDISSDEKNEVLLDAGSIEAYSFVSTTALYLDFTVGKLKNDQIKMPSADQIFVNARIGGQTLNSTTGYLNAGLYYETVSGKKKTESEIPYKLQMRVSSPSGQVKYYELGKTSADKYVETGKYYMQLVVLGEVSENRWEELASASPVVVNIGESVDSIWFETTLSNIESGYTYKYYFSVNSNYWRTTSNDIEITTSSSETLQVIDVVYQNNGKGYVEVKALKAGKAEIVLSAKLTRVYEAGQKNETTAITVSVVSSSKKSNDTIKIVLICVLSVGAAAAIAYAAYEIVKHNKMQIK